METFSFDLALLYIHFPALLLTSQLEVGWVFGDYHSVTGNQIISLSGLSAELLDVNNIARILF